jgi:hypothetical protein
MTDVGVGCPDALGLSVHLFVSFRTEWATLSFLVIFEDLV